MVSSQQGSLDPIHEAVESAASGIKKMFAFKRSENVPIIDAVCKPVSGLSSWSPPKPSEYVEPVNIARPVVVGANGVGSALSM
jgi:hypothetical protein